MPTARVTATLAAIVLTASLAGASAAAARPAPTVSGLDRQYLTTSIQGDRFEIEGGQLALRKSQNAAVRALAARLVKDHTQSLAESAALARRLGVDVPKRATPSQRWELGIASGMAGRGFDRAYSSLEGEDHWQDIMESSDEVAHGSNHAVRHDAFKELPVLRQHLALARQALARS